MVHLVDWLGRVVTEDLALLLIRVQSVVREHFGWSYDDDLSSANKMSILFSNPSPYGIEKWSAKTRETNKNNLQRILQESERVIIVGASITDEELSAVNLENCAIIAASNNRVVVGNEAGEILVWDAEMLNRRLDKDIDVAQDDHKKAMRDRIKALKKR